MKNEKLLQIQTEDYLVDLSIHGDAIWLGAGFDDELEFSYAKLSIKDAKLLVEKLNKAITLLENQ